MCNFKFVLMDPSSHRWLFPFLMDSPLLLLCLHNIVVCFFKTFNALLLFRLENGNQLPGEKNNREVRRPPNFSGPLMLSARASANSLSAPIKSSGGT